MKEKLKELIASNKGRMVAMLAAFITGGIMQAVTSLGLQLEADDAVLISGMAAMAAGWIIESIAAKINGTAVSRIQEALPGVAASGHANEATVAAVESLAAAALPANVPGSSRAPLSMKEGILVKDNLHSMVRKNPELAAMLRLSLQSIDTTKP